MIKINQTNLKFNTLRQGDKGFTLTDGFVVIPRAGFEINQKCPKEYRMIIQECLSNGWIKPVATVPDNEFVFDTLKGIHL